MIELKNIVKTYQMGSYRFEALKGISMKVNDGELVAIIGPSGSGKSTTMNILGLLDRQTSGQYFLNGQEVEDLSPNKKAALRNQYIGFIFQAFFLLPNLNALENVALPLSYRNVSSAEQHKRAMEMLEKVGMDQYAHHLPKELSGGQQQRVAIARALAGKPALILADEPTGALDSKTSQQVLDLLAELNKDEKATVIIITHDPLVARQCPRAFRIADGLLTEGHPDHTPGDDQ